MSANQSSAAASRLSHPAERGSLALAYRRSVVALQTVFGARSSQDPASRPLLEGNRDDAAASTSAQRGYGSVMDLPPEQRVPKPKKVVSPVRVEAKVWLANERTWISWLRVSVLIGSFALALFNSASFFSKHNVPHGPGTGNGEPGPVYPSHPAGPDPGTIKIFGAGYAIISVMTLLWGLYSYQRRVSLIKSKWAGDFDDLIGPPVICVSLFVAVLLNFIVRVKQHNAESMP